MSFNIDSPYTFFHKEVSVLNAERKRLDLSKESQVDRFELKIENLLEFINDLSFQTRDPIDQRKYDYYDDKSKLLKIAEAFRDSVSEGREREQLKSKSIVHKAFFEIGVVFKKIGKFIWQNVQRVFPRDFTEIDQKVSAVYKEFKTSIASKNTQSSPNCNYEIDHALHNRAKDLAKVTASIEAYKNSLGNDIIDEDFTKFIELADWIWNVYQDSSALLKPHSFRDHNVGDYDSIREDLKKLETIYYSVVNYWIDTLEASALASENRVRNSEAAASSSAVHERETPQALSLPPPLLKWYENSCYRNASYQAIFSLPHYFNQLTQLSHRVANGEELDPNPQINGKLKALVAFFDYYRLLQAADRRDSRNYNELQNQAMVAERRFRGLLYSENRGIFSRREELRMNDSNLFVTSGVMNLLHSSFRFRQTISGEYDGAILSSIRDNQILNMLDVNIPTEVLGERYNVSLEDLLYNTFNDEIDDVYRGWQYDDQHYLTRYSKKRELMTIPEVLPIHFVRQRQNRSGAEPLYLGKPVEVPLTVDMSPYVNREVSESQPVNYELNSFVIYVGAHYISVTKRGNKWYVCDDANSSNNREIDPNSNEFAKLKNTCYNCYYKRVN